MKPTKKTYSVSVKVSRDYQSVNVTEGVEVEIDEGFDELAFEEEKQKLKERLNSEARAYLSELVEDIRIDNELEDI